MMLLKVVFLLSTSAVLGLGLKVEPEDLLSLYERIDNAIKTGQHEVQIELRDLIIPMDNLINEAASYIMGNLSLAAQPYWAKIASLEEEAEGQDISECINSGNEQLYALNDTSVDPPLAQIAFYKSEGNETLVNGSYLAASAVIELLELEVQVKACSNATCAEELFNVLVEFHGRAEEAIQAAVAVPVAYLAELPEKLALIHFDADAYTEKLGWILDAVEICILL